MNSDLRPVTYNGNFITFKKAWFGRGVQATAYKGGKVMASAGGMSKDEALSILKRMLK